MVGGKNRFLNADKLSFDVHILTVAYPSSQMLKKKGNIDGNTKKKNPQNETHINNCTTQI